MMHESMAADHTDGEENKQDGIFLFEDILDLIFAKMSFKDLSRAAAVCTVWRCTAKREMSKRNQIQGLIIPIKEKPTSIGDYVGLNKYGEGHQYLQTWHLCDSLSSSPDVLLLFGDNTYEGHGYDADLFLQIYRIQAKESDDIIVLIGLGVTKNNTEVSAKFNQGLGISIPATSKLKIKSLHTMELASHKDALLKLLYEVDKDLDIDGNDHNCFIYFESCVWQDEGLVDKKLTNELFERLRNRCKPGTYSLFGGFTSYMANREFNCTNYFLLKISGPDIHSWSIVVEENCPSGVMEKNLLKFKEGVKLTCNSIALAAVPSNKNESYEKRLKKTELFRRIFPKVPLFGIYDENEKFGVNSTCSDSASKFIHENAIVYLIITTD